MGRDIDDLTATDRARLGEYDPIGTADLLFDRNWAEAMEERGYLEYAGGCTDGSRSYRLTAAGRRAHSVISVYQQGYNKGIHDALHAPQIDALLDGVVDRDHPYEGSSDKDRDRHRRLIKTALRIEIVEALTSNKVSETK